MNRYFAMKLFFIVCVFWVTTSIEGVPNDYAQWLQPRSIGNLPFINWFIGNSSEENGKESSATTIFLQHTNDPANSDKLKLKEINPINHGPEPNGIIHAIESAEKVSNDEKKMNEENLEKSSIYTNDDNIKVIPINKPGPNDKPEPIENLLNDLKQEVQETKDNQEKNNISALLMNLKKTMTETPTHLAKVFVNNAWRIFDIGALGTTRRTRNVNDTGILLNLYYTLLNLITQLLGGQHLGGNNLIGNIHSQGKENIHNGGLMELLLPSVLTSYFGSPSVNQKVVGGIAGLPGGHTQNSTKKVYIICLDDENKKNANRLLHGKTPDEVLSKIEILLKKRSLDTEEKFYIVLRLQDLYDRLSGNNDKTALKLINLIIEISEDPRFDQLFEILKSKNDPDYDDIWELFKKKPKLNENYLSIIRNLPGEQIIEHPSRDCFIITPIKHTMKSHRAKIDYDSDSDDEDSNDEDFTQNKKSGAKVKTILMKLDTRDPKLKSNYYVCCIDDDDELKANRILNGRTKDDIIIQIEKYLKKDDLNPQYKWYIILKLYTMLKDSEKPDKVDKKDEDIKKKIIKLIILIGEDPKFEELLKGLKTKDNPRFREIWKLLKNEPRDPQEEVKLQINKEKEQQVIPAASSKPHKEEIENQTEPNKVDEVIKNDPPQVQIPPQKIIYDRNQLPDISKNDWTFWRSEYDPLLKNIEIQIKDPDLGPESKWALIDFIDRWYLSNVIDPKVKPKLNGLVKMIGEDPKFNETFETIKKYNVPDVTKRVFDRFGKGNKNSQIGPLFSAVNVIPPKASSTQHSYFTYSTTTFGPDYYWDDKRNRPTDDGVAAKLPLSKKLNTLIDLFTMRNMDGPLNFVTEENRQRALNHAQYVLNNDRKDFDNFENVLLPQLIGKPDLVNGDSDKFTTKMLNDFREFLLSSGDYIVGQIYSNGEERRKMQNFIDRKKMAGELLGKSVGQ